MREKNVSKKKRGLGSKKKRKTEKMREKERESHQEKYGGKDRVIVMGRGRVTISFSYTILK